MLRPVRLRHLPRSAALPPSRPRDKGVCALASRLGSVTVRRPRGGREVPPAVRELPRGGRGRSPRRGGLRCWARLPITRRGEPFRGSSSFRGSSIRQSIRLLIEGLWVRVPPPELLHFNR